MKKSLILMFMLIFLVSISFSYSWVYFENTGFSPINSNLTYYTPSTGLNATTVSLDNNCLNTTGPNSSYCYNLNSIYTDDIVLFENKSSLNCYINLETEVGDILNLNYYWYNSSGNLLKSGTEICEQDTLCLLDTISPEHILGSTGVTCQAVYIDFYNITTPLTEPRIKANIGECSGSTIYPILNISYFDEGNLQPINLTNVYNLNFYDGQTNINIEGTFNLDYDNQICIDIDPLIKEVELELTGQYILSKEDYVSRAITRQTGNELIVSNTNPAQENLYLVEVDNSSTITFTWRTPFFEYINGQMLIYSCDNSNNIVLIDTVNINSGTAVANLQLLTQPYYYKVLYEGETFEDTTSFSTCHIESKSEVTYLIDVFSINLEPVLGLFLVDCGVEKINTNTVKMQWSSNYYDNSDITACIIGKRTLPTGLTEIYRNCSTSPSGSFIRTVPDNNNAYYIIGEITQNGNTRQCKNQISFFTQSDTSKSFGVDGVLAMILFIIAMVLLFSNSGLKQMFGIGISLVVVFILGILSIPLEALVGIIIFLLIIGIIGRYSRKK